MDPPVRPARGPDSGRAGAEGRTTVREGGAFESGAPRPCLIADSRAGMTGDPSWITGSRSRIPDDLPTDDRSSIADAAVFPPIIFPNFATNACDRLSPAVMGRRATRFRKARASRSAAGRAGHADCQGQEMGERMMRGNRQSILGCSRHRRRGGAGAGPLAALLLVALVLLAGRVRAAEEGGDRPYPPSWYFSGFYLGLYAGHFNPSLHARQDGAKLKTTPRNGEGGLTAGFGLRLGDRTVLAIEGEFAFIDLIDTQGLLDDDLIEAILDAAIPDGTASLGVRVGYAVTDRLLIYGRTAWSVMAFGSEANSSFNGVRFGGGTEWRIWKGLALRIELIHDEYERKRFKQGLSLRPSATSFRGGLTLHF